MRLWEPKKKGGKKKGGDLPKPDRKDHSIKF